MPNYCGYQMRVKGTKKDIEEFNKVITADYNYTKNEFTFDRHFWRVFDADFIFEDEYEDMKDDDTTIVEIHGVCAWSVFVCMFDGPHTYQGDMKDKEGNKGTTILEECKKLNLEIEIFSSEPGCCFAEYYYMINGELKENMCVDYTEEYEDEDCCEDYVVHCELTDEDGYFEYKYLNGYVLD